jgi:hypothetical protein
MSTGKNVKDSAWLARGRLALASDLPTTPRH